VTNAGEVSAQKASSGGAKPGVTAAHALEHQAVAERDLSCLDWPEVLQQLARYAESARGQAGCLALPLLPTVQQARGRSSAVAELISLYRLEQRWPVLSFPDVAAQLELAETGGTLGAEELVVLAQFCDAVGGVRRYFAERERDTPEESSADAPFLLAAGLGDHHLLSRKARDTFDASGEIRDSASPELAQLRRDRDRLAARTRAQIERLLADESYAPYLQDHYVTLRADRFVLPVKASFKSMALGIVHDTSRTGETVFLEPASVVEANNRLKVVELGIRRECHRILQELAALVAASADQLRRDLETLARLDCLTAMARFSMALDATPVQLVEEPVIEARELRHPLLSQRALRERFEVVGNDVGLDESQRALVISGPNAGGKTILLKSLGLAALFARSGLHLPAAPGARIGFFTNIMADVGDNQSVMGDLSTFSAHLENFARICSAAQASTGPALVLCDELMAGTNPEQGAALARATLESLASAGCLLVATTHYDSLKALADADDRFVNAGMEYDMESLRPTYRLRVGRPGRSFAFDMAAALGLPDAVIARARSLTGASTDGLEGVLRDMEAREQRLAQAEAALDVAQREAKAQAGREKEAAKALEKRERELARHTRTHVEAAVREAREALRDIVKSARTKARHGKVTEVVAQARQAVEAQSAVATAGLPEPEPLDLAKLKEALANRALGVASNGSSTRSSARSASGGAKRQKPQGRRGPARSAAAFVQEPAPKAEPLVRTANNTVDVRGHRADDAMAEVEAFLDDAALANKDAVFVLHGYGTGALRRVVREYLALSPYASSYRPGREDEGGDGVTVVTLRG